MLQLRLKRLHHALLLDELAHMARMRVLEAALGIRGRLARGRLSSDDGCVLIAQCELGRLELACLDLLVVAQL